MNVLIDKNDRFEVYFKPLTKEENATLEKELNFLGNYKCKTLTDKEKLDTLKLQFWGCYETYPEDIIYYGDTEYTNAQLDKVISSVVLKNRKIYAGSTVFDEKETCKSYRTFSGRTDYATTPFDISLGCVVPNETAIEAWNELMVKLRKPSHGIVYKQFIKS